MSVEIRTQELAVSIEPETGRLGFALSGGPALQTGIAPRLRLGGTLATVREVKDADGEVRVVLAGEGVAGVWRLRALDDAIECTIDMDGAWGDRPVEVEIPFPLSAAVELPVDQRHGARIDASCVPGRDGGVPLSGMKNQLAAVDTGGAALAFIGLGDYTRHVPGTYGNVWQAGAHRDEDCLWLRLQVLNGARFHISGHADLTGVIDRYCRVLREKLGVLTLAEDPSAPDWLDQVRVFVGFEMFRSDGEILNTFAHVTSFCRDLQKLGVSEGVAVRLEGFQGRFDSRYPYFDPADELGGPAGMREATEAIHAGGHRLAAHFNIWGLDPYLENFEELEHLAMPYDRVYERIPTGQIGPYDGWPGPYPAVPTGFDSGFLPIQPLEGGDSHTVFETCEIPAPMEAFLSLRGVRLPGGGRLRAEIDGRKVKTLRGDFDRSDRVRFRFRFRFAPGVNRVRLDFPGPAPDLSRADYRVGGSVGAGRVWSYPIIRGDIHHPGWIALTGDNMVRVCRDYDIDIPYIDAINIWRDEDRPIFDMIRERLPGRLFACEYSAELGYSMFRLTGTGLTCVPTKEDAGYVVTDFSRRVHERFTRFFTSGYAYVPYGGPGCSFGRLCAAEGERRKYAERHLAEFSRWGVCPAVRVNYRDHGLDDRAAEIVLEACGK